MLVIGAAVAVLVIPSPSQAWDGQVPGKIIGIDVADSDNYDFLIDPAVSSTGAVGEHCPLPKTYRTL